MEKVLFFQLDHQSVQTWSVHTSTNPCAAPITLPIPTIANWVSTNAFIPRRMLQRPMMEHAVQMQSRDLTKFDFFQSKNFNFLEADCAMKIHSTQGKPNFESKNIKACQLKSAVHQFNLRKTLMWLQPRTYNFIISCTCLFTHSNIDRFDLVF